MRRKLMPLLAVLAVSLAAVGGVAAADGAEIPTEEAANDSTDGPEMGVCVVGADSPCNDEPTDGDAEPATHPTPLNDNDELGHGADGDESQMWIPEDQNHDGEIDERFQGDAPGDTASDDSRETTGSHISSNDGDESQMWIPEDQNHDGEIDDRFGGDGLPALLFDVLPF